MKNKFYKGLGFGVTFGGADIKITEGIDIEYKPDRKVIKKKIIEKEIFDTVYQWGRVGIVVDETCNTYQRLLKQYRKALKEDAKNETKKSK